MDRGQQANLGFLMTTESQNLGLTSHQSIDRMCLTLYWALGPTQTPASLTNTSLAIVFPGVSHPSTDQAQPC